MGVGRGGGEGWIIVGGGNGVGYEGEELNNMWFVDEFEEFRMIGKLS